MQTVSTDIHAAPLPLRNDTILGVCEGIGEDFGFNPNWLRLVFASTFYFAPLLVVGTYLGLGLVVAASRYFAPKQAAAPKLTDTADNSDQEMPGRLVSKRAWLPASPSPPDALRHCEHGEAIHPSPAWIASLSLAMTGVTPKTVPFRHGS